MAMLAETLQQEDVYQCVYVCVYVCVCMCVCVCVCVCDPCLVWGSEMYQA